MGLATQGYRSVEGLSMNYVDQTVAPRSAATDKSDIQNINFIISKPNLIVRHSFESSRRDDSNECHTIRFGPIIK